RPIFGCFVCITDLSVAATHPHLQSIVQQEFTACHASAQHAPLRGLLVQPEMESWRSLLTGKPNWLRKESRIHPRQVFQQARVPGHKANSVGPPVRGYRTAAGF